MTLAQWKEIQAEVGESGIYLTKEALVDILSEMERLSRIVDEVKPHITKLACLDQPDRIFGGDSNVANIKWARKVLKKWKLK